MHNSQDTTNSENGVVSSQSDSSLGRDGHVRQVIPDRHQATVRNSDSIRIGTWNVQALWEAAESWEATNAGS